MKGVIWLLNSLHDAPEWCLWKFKHKTWTMQQSEKWGIKEILEELLGENIQST
jgi:hypothetical protein